MPRGIDHEPEASDLVFGRGDEKAPLLEAYVPFPAERRDDFDHVGLRL
jgi:hypothetical protein